MSAFMKAKVYTWAGIFALLVLIAPPTLAQATPPTLTYISGSTVKLEQLLGDEDKQLQQPTLSQTVTRYGIEGTDLGYNYEYQGQIYFLFGDTVGQQDRALDTIATTTADDDPEQGVRLDFLTSGSSYLTIRPPGIKMGAFETPIGGLNLNDQMYIAVRTDHSDDWSTDRSVLVKFTLPDSFQPLRTISQAPTGHFLTLMTHVQPDSMPTDGLPPGGPFVIVWGTGLYRQSDVYLMLVPEASFEGGAGARYFAGLDAAGTPIWSERESDAAPLTDNGTLGDISVTWNDALGLWLMTYDSRSPAPQGILFSYSPTIWGPWSEPQVIFNAERDGAMGTFIHDPRHRPADGLEGPVIGQGQANPSAVRGGAYAPYVVERWTKVQGSELDLYYALSTWNPYVVVLMKSRLTVG